MPSARLILCEKTTRWAVALRRSLGKRQGTLAETRGMAQCSRELAASPASLVVVETTADNLAAVVAALPELGRRFPLARFVAVGEAVDFAEGLLREAGVVSALATPRQARQLARLALRHVAHAPAADLPLAEAIWDRLPWPAAADAVNT
jgi:hypothetical protein